MTSPVLSLERPCVSSCPWSPLVFAQAALISLSGGGDGDHPCGHVCGLLVNPCVSCLCSDFVPSACLFPPSLLGSAISSSPPCLQSLPPFLSLWLPPPWPSLASPLPFCLLPLTRSNCSPSYSASGLCCPTDSAPFPSSCPSLSPSVTSSSFSSRFFSFFAFFFSFFSLCSSSSFSFR